MGKLMLQLKQLPPKKLAYLAMSTIVTLLVMGAGAYSGIQYFTHAQTTSVSATIVNAQDVPSPTPTTDFAHIGPIAPPANGGGNPTATPAASPSATLEPTATTILLPSDSPTPFIVTATPTPPKAKPTMLSTGMNPWHIGIGSAILIAAGAVGLLL